MARNGYRFTRWNGDTETAFLLALKLHGSVAKACALIGRSAHGAQDRRKANPEFAAKWAAMLAEWRAEEVARKAAAAGLDEPGTMPNRIRYDGWTPMRQRHFLRALTETGKLEDSCKAVGLSAASLRKMRRRYPSFDAACARALGRADATLEQIAYERAVDGWDEPILWQGKVVGYRRQFSHALLAMLLRQEQATTLPKRASDPKHAVRIAEEAARRAGGFFGTYADPEDTDRTLMRRLDQIEKWRRREGLLDGLPPLPAPNADMDEEEEDADS